MQVIGGRLEQQIRGLALCQHLLLCPDVSGTDLQLGGFHRASHGSVSCCVLLAKYPFLLPPASQCEHGFDVNKITCTGRNVKI